MSKTNAGKCNRLTGEAKPQMRRIGQKLSRPAGTISASAGEEAKDDGERTGMVLGSLLVIHA